MKRQQCAASSMAMWSVAFGLAALTWPAMAGGLPTLDCVIKPHVTVDIGTPVEGVVQSIAVDKNDLVAQGQVLATLKSDVEKATVALARARAKASGRTESRRAAMAFGRRKLARTDELYQKKVVSFNAKDEAETDAHIARLAFQEAEEDKIIARLEMGRALELLNQRTITSPIAGVVIEREAYPGEFVDDQPLLSVAQLDPLRVEAIVPVTLFGTIHKGMHAKVTPELPGSQAYEATVSSVDRVLDGSSGTFGVRLELPNPDYRLPGGLRCKLRLLDKPAPAPSKSVNAAPPVPAPHGASIAQAAPASVPKTTAPAKPARPKRASPPPVAKEAMIAQGGPTCRTVGPIATSGRADKIAQALDGRVRRLSRRVETPSRVTRYIVVTPRQKTSAAAERLAERLRKAGLAEPWIVPKGELKGHISLGVFLNKASARRLRETLAARGIAADVKPRHREQTRIWLDVEVPARDLDSVTKAIRTVQPGLSLQSTECHPMKTAQN